MAVRSLTLSVRFPLLLCVCRQCEGPQELHPLYKFLKSKKEVSNAPKHDVLWTQCLS